MKALLLTPNGIGDGLLMMIAYHQLQKAGYAVTLYHEKAEALAPLFLNASVAPAPEKIPSSDLLLVLNDNSKRAWDLIRNRESYPELHFLFPTPCKAMRSQDFLFDPKKPVATNLAHALKKILGKAVTKENGITIPETKQRAHPKRIVIHPTSADVKRNWLPQQYLKLADRLRAKGFTAVFATSAAEHPYWEFVEEAGFALPHFSNLAETAAYIFESGALIGNDSGLGHLASNLGTPTFTISGNKKRVQLWRPDFCAGAIATPLFPLPNFKGIGFRMRESCWQIFMPVRTVCKKFLKFYEKSSNHPL